MGDKYQEEIIKPGDNLSKFAFEVNVASYNNCKAIEIFPDPNNDWRGTPRIVWRPHILDAMKERVNVNGRITPLMWESPQSDGGGHKPSVYTLIGDFKNLARDIIVMCDHDILREGGLPCWVASSNIDFKQLTAENLEMAKAVIRGYGKELADAKMAGITGETAVMPYSVAAFCDTGNKTQLILNWMMTCIGLYHNDQFIGGEKVESKMPIVGFYEPGVRCNGVTYCIDLMKYLMIDNTDSLEAICYARRVIQPSTSYSKTLKRVFGWNDDGTIQKLLVNIVKCFHITGGGLLGRLKFTKGIGAYLYNMFIPSDVLMETQEMGWDIPELRKTDKGMLSTFNGSVGFAVVCETELDAQKLVKEAKKDGVVAKIIGETIESRDGEVKIESKFKEGGIVSSLA